MATNKQLKKYHVLKNVFPTLMIRKGFAKAAIAAMPDGDNGEVAAAGLLSANFLLCCEWFQEAKLLLHTRLLLLTGGSFNFILLIHLFNLSQSHISEQFYRKR